MLKKEEVILFSSFSEYSNGNKVFIYDDNETPYKNMENLIKIISDNSFDKGYEMYNDSHIYENIFCG